MVTEKSQSSTIAPTSEQPDPSLLWDSINGYQRTAVLQAAIELEVFTGVGEGQDTPQALAARCHASERGIRILCDHLTVTGFLKKEAGQYSLTPTSAAFLDQHSPAYLGTIVRFMNSPEVMSSFDNLIETVRKGTTLMGGVVDPEDPFWIEFARNMAPLVAPAAEFIGQFVADSSNGPIRVLDIAAGHGLFGIAVAKQNPKAEIVALDWLNVLEVAQENARAAGIENRYRLLAGDAFKVEFGDGFDLVLITNLFHHFDLPTCESLVHKIYTCLKPGGLAINLEFVPNEDRISPPIPATFSLTMLVATPAGDAYTFQQFDQMFHDVGFKKNEIMEVPQSPQHVIVSYK